MEWNLIGLYISIIIAISGLTIATSSRNKELSGLLIFIFGFFVSFVFATESYMISFLIFLIVLGLSLFQVGFANLFFEPDGNKKANKIRIIMSVIYIIIGLILAFISFFYSMK